MRRWYFLAMAIAFWQALFVSFSWAQAAAEYGIAASKSAASTAKMGSTINAGTQKLAGRIESTLSRSTAASMEESKRKLEESSRKGGATLHIDSLPEKALVSIDGATVGYTPADLKVPEGKHVVQLTRTGYLLWKQEISVTREKNVSLKAELENKYKSVVNLSNPK